MKVRALLYYVFLFSFFALVVLAMFHINKMAVILFVILCLFCQFYRFSNKEFGIMAKLFLDTIAFLGFLSFLTIFVNVICTFTFYKYSEATFDKVFASIVAINILASAAFIVNEYKQMQIKRAFKILILSIVSFALLCASWHFVVFSVIALFL